MTNINMVHIKGILRTAALVIVMMTSSFRAHAQSDPITIHAEVSRTRVYVGDELTYQVIVRGANNPPTPEVEFPDSVRARYQGRSNQAFTSTRVINGRSRTVTDRRYSYQYTLTAIDSGELTIPAPSVEIDGQRYVGPPTTFESLFPTEVETDEMTISIERNELYLNETVIVECSWWIGEQTSGPSFSSSSLPRSFRITGLEPTSRGRDQISFELNGQQMLGVISTDSSDPFGRTKLLFRFSITPTEVGTFDLGPIRAVFTRQSNSRQGYKAYIESNIERITVRNVPTEGRPKGYAGAMGAYQLKTQASNTVVNVGDPIVLTLKISAPEPMVGVDEAPDLSNDPRFTDRFKISSDGWRELRPRQRGQRVYETTIRALNEHIDQIPPIELPSFNPTTESYRIYKSNPIDLIVHPVQELTLSDAIITGDTAARTPQPQAVERTELTNAMPGLWAHDTADDILAQDGFSIVETIRHPGWIAVIASGPALFSFSLIIVVARGASDPQGRALQSAWKRSRSLARQGKHAQAFRAYLAGILEINEDAVVAEDARRLPIDKADADRIAELIADEEHEYDAEHNHRAPPTSDLPQGLLKGVHTQVKHHRRARS